MLSNAKSVLFSRNLKLYHHAMNGALFKRRTECGKPQCGCHTDKSKRHGPYFYFNFKYKGKNHQVYVVEKKAAVIRSCLRAYKDLKKMFEDLTYLNVQEIIKKG
jgi:hypothetical protein